MDVLTPEQRQKNMSRIRGKETKPEIIVRKFLFSRGVRYRKNDRKLPGHPDIVFPKYHTVVFVNGCFWHGHENCRYYRLPKTNTVFWRNKIERNKERDSEIITRLESLGWKAIIVWECEIKTKTEMESRLRDLYNSIIGKSG